MFWTGTIKKLSEDGIISRVGEITVEAETEAEAQLKLIEEEKRLPVDQYLSAEVTIEKEAK